MKKKKKKISKIKKWKKARDFHVITIASTATAGRDGIFFFTVSGANDFFFSFFNDWLMIHTGELCSNVEKALHQVF